MADLFPSLVHLENNTMMIYPHWSRLDMMFGETNYDWSQQYTSHIWDRLVPDLVPKSPSDIENFNSTVAQMMRYIYDGPR